MKKILIKDPQKILSFSLMLLFIGASCEQGIDLPITERRIHCESGMLRAHDPVNDIMICEAGNGQSCFNQMDVAVVFGELKSCKRQLALCQKTCPK